MNKLVAQANDILRSGDFDYAFCGGHAIDLFLGYESRTHGDIDILAYWSERDEIIKYMQSLGYDIYEMLGGGRAHKITDIAVQMKMKRNIFCWKDTCELVDFYPTEETDVFRIDFHHSGLTRLDFIEFLFNDKTESDFLYARNHDIRRALEKAILSADGVPYLAPELCLLYKTTDTEREGYQQDYELAMSKMTDEQREWFFAAARSLYPDGHKWGR